MARAILTPLRRALLAGDPNLLWPLPPLLAAAGFKVDVVILEGTHVRRQRGLGRVAVVDTPTEALTAAAHQSGTRHYDWIIIGDDVSLRLLRTSPDLSLADRLRLAPVTGAKHLDHLGSKNVLAQRLGELPVPSPRFRLACSPADAAEATEQFGGTALLKPDFGSGGAWLILAEDPTQAAVGWHLMAARQNQRHLGPTREVPSVLVQEYLGGRLVDVSAIFMGGLLIHYTYAHMQAATTRFGASSVRHYYPTSTASPAIAAELGIIGAGLGLHGFANVTCIESEDGSSRHYFEVDARPNLWVGFGAEFGDDPVARLKLWFDEGRIDLPAPFDKDGGEGMPAPTSQGRKVAMFKGMSRNDLLRNRHGVWRDVPWGSPEGRRLLRRALFG